MKKFTSLVLSMLVVLFFVQGYTNSASAATLNSSIKLTQSKLSIYVGQSKQLTYKAQNIKKNPIVWSTSNSGVVSVKNGKVTALKPGKANITVSVPKLKIKSVATVSVSKKKLSAKEAFDKVNKSVVYIESYNQNNQLVGTGSGFIVSKDGKIVTNHHVVSDVSLVSRVKIKLSNGITYETSRVKGYNADKDIVILKIDGPTNLPVVTLADSSKVQTGEKVYALGSPRGVQNTITEGIVSNRNVVIGKNQFIQTSAPITPGNSGGVLVNIYGEVIGVNDLTRIDAQNMNYAIPINVYKQIPANSNYDLIEINRAYYVPAHGKGSVEEEESNNTIDDADYIPYSDAMLYGTFSNNQDMDFYYFLITDNETVSIIASTTDAKYSEDLTFALYDVDGEFIDVCTAEWDPERQRYYCYLSNDLTPGFYHIGVYVDPQAKYNNAGQEYSVSVWIGQQ
ncbi:trypsin-like peptidase domain-containing protein [Bacillus sp. JJ664]